MSDSSPGPREADSGPAPSTTVRRIPPLALVLALWLAVGAVIPAPALLDAATAEVPGGVRLDRPLSYLLFSPVFGVLDLLNLVTPAQHLALVTTVLGLFVGVRTTRRRRGRVTTPAWKPWGALLLSVMAAYAASGSVPRPTPQVVADNPDLVRVDFHSHTRHSADVGSGYTIEWNRAWHERTGFDAVYVTDHGTRDGLREAAASNPSRAGDGVVLLAGAELEDDGRGFLELGRAPPVGAPPTRILPLLARGDPLMAPLAGTPAGVVGLEVIDGTPQGLFRSRTERGRIVQLADSLDVALVSGSNNHGWGQTAAAWSLVDIPGWRRLAPETLAESIEAKLRAGGRAAVTVVERPVPGARGEWLQIFSAPVLAWHLTRTASTGERTAWLFWLVVAWALTGRRRVGPDREP